MTREFEPTSPLPERTNKPPALAALLTEGLDNPQARAAAALEAIEAEDRDKDDDFGFEGELPVPPAERRKTGPVMSIPMWEQVGTVENPEGYQLRIQRVTPTGVPEEMGTLAADASQEELIAAYRRPGKYKVMPVNEHGRPQRPNPYVVVIPRDHPLFESLARNEGELESVGGGHMPMPMMGGGFGGMGSPLIDFLTEQSKQGHERQAMADRMSYGIAQSTADRARIQLEFEAARNSKTLETTIGTIASQTAALREEQSRAHTAQLEAVRSQSEAHVKLVENFGAKQTDGMATILSMMMTLNAEREKDRAEASRERERERDRAEERERNRQAQLEAERRAERERAEERERQHTMAMLELVKQRSDAQNPMAMIATLVAMAAPFAGALGITGEDVKNLVRRIVAGEEPPPPPEESGGFMAEVFKTVRGGMEMMKAMAEAQAQAAAQQAFGPEDEEDEDEDEPEDPQGPALADYGPPQTVPVAQEAVFLPQGVMRPPPRPQAAQNPSGAIPEGFARTPTMADPVAGLDPDVKQTGRKAVAMLVGKLRTTPQEGWKALFENVLFENPTQAPKVLAYLQAATVRRAARDAGAPAEMVEGFVQWMDNTYRETPIVMGIPRG